MDVLFTYYTYITYVRVVHTYTHHEGCMNVLRTTQVS